MASISYDEIYSSFYILIDDYSLTALAQTDAFLHMNEYLRQALGRPFLRRQFVTVSRDDEIQVLEYELNRTDEIDTQLDEDFVVLAVSKMMAYEWASRKVISIKNIAQGFMTAEKKYYSQAQHLSQLRALRDDMYAEVQRLISDRGFTDNSYLDGTSVAATQRTVTS